MFARHPASQESVFPSSIAEDLMTTLETPTQELFAEAQTVLAGGVSASMRLNPYLDLPLYIQRGEGAYVYDLEGKRFVDFNMSNGAALLGHNHPRIKEAVIAGVE